MNKHKHLFNFITVCLLVVSLIATSAAPAFAEGSVHNGWYPQHIMPGISDTPVTGASGDWYLMPNLPLMQSSGIPTYDTSLTYEQFYQMLIVNDVDYGTGLCPNEFCYSMANLEPRVGITSRYSHLNFLVKCTYVLKAESCEQAIQLTQGIAFSTMSIWDAMPNGEPVSTANLDAFNLSISDLIKDFNISTLFGVLRSWLRSEPRMSEYFYAEDWEYWQPAITNAASRSWSWAFFPTSSPSDAYDPNYTNFGYWVGFYEDNGELIEGVRYYLNSTSGSNLDKVGTSGGATTPRDYYTEEKHVLDEVTDADVYAVYEGETSSYPYIDYHDNQIYNIEGDQFINDGSLWYDNSSHEYTYVTENYYITVNNYYTYNYVNYYMPGSDVPFSTYAVYYQLPDGRNSATLTADDIFGMSLDYDVIPYDQASEDTRMLALYHLDGTFDNEAITYSYQGGAVDTWQFDFKYQVVSWPWSDPYTFTYNASKNVNWPAGTYTLSGNCNSETSASRIMWVIYYTNSSGTTVSAYPSFANPHGGTFTSSVTVSGPVTSIILFSGNDSSTSSGKSCTYSNVTLTCSNSYVPHFTTSSVIQSSLTYNYVNNPTATTLTGSDPVWTAPYDGYYRISFKSSGSAANIGYSNTSFARMIWTLNGSPFFGTVLDARSSSTQVGNYIAGDFSRNLSTTLTVHTFSTYLSAGDELQFSAAYQPDSSGSSVAANVTVQDVTIYGYGETNSQAALGDFSDFEFTNGASTQFVTTGDENYAGSLFLDGLGHDFQISLPENPNARYGDWTVTFRYYQEQSTNTGISYVSFGADSYAGNVAFASLVFDGAHFKYLMFDGYTSNYVNYGSGTDITIPYGTWNTITLCRSGGQLLFFLNGIQVANVSQGTSSVTPDGNIYFHFAADSNVHYIDEIMVASYAMYTANHTPRLIPWDSNNVYVLPYAVNKNSIAVKTPFAISGYRIGGVRPTFPDKGMIYAYIDNNYITSIQVYNGSAWIDCGGAVFFNGHWYSIENFRFGTVSEQFDADPSQTQAGSQQGSMSILDLLNNLLNGIKEIVLKVGDILEKFVDTTGSIISEAIKDFTGLIASLAGFVVSGLSSLVNGFVGLISSISSHIGNWFSLTAPIGSLFSGVYGAIPAALQYFLIGGFAVGMTAAVINFINK